MKRILQGNWTYRNGQPAHDEVCDEIDRRIAQDLEEVCRDDSGWLTLFRDRRDGTLWERSYPQSQLHSGGPPQLAELAFAEAQLRYGDKVR